MKSATVNRIVWGTRVGLAALFCIAALGAPPRPAQAAGPDEIKCAKTCIGLYQKHIKSLVTCALKGAKEADSGVTTECAAKVEAKNADKWSKSVDACNGQTCRMTMQVAGGNLDVACVYSFVAAAAGNEMFVWVVGTEIVAGGVLQPYFAAASAGCPAP